MYAAPCVLLLTMAEEPKTTDPARNAPGADAESPYQIPLLGWGRILLRVAKSFGEYELSLVAAGIAFYSFLGLFPAIGAFVSIYGFFVDPLTLESQVSTYLGAMPFEVREIVGTELKRISTSGIAGTAAIISISLAIWGGSKSAAAFMRGMNVVYRERDRRGIIKSRLTALALTGGIILMGLLGIALLGVLPYLMKSVYFAEEWVETTVLFVRWPVFVILMLVSLAFLYRIGPDRADPKWRWISVGAVVASLLIILASWIFGLLIAKFGDFNTTYGSLGAVVVLLLWLQIVATAVLFGGLINAHMEFQTHRDSTTGEEKPMGERGAFMADHSPLVPKEE